MKPINTSSAEVDEARHQYVLRLLRYSKVPRAAITDGLPRTFTYE